MTTSVTIADDSVLLPAPSAFLAKQLSVTAVHPMPTCRTRRSWIKINTAALEFLLPSRYCEVDSELMDFAWQTFSQTRPGWGRVQALCDFVHEHLQFDYQQVRSDRTALEAFGERVGVCRDFTHLAITLCRCMNIPARYATGYLGDIGVPPVPDPMDFALGLRFTCRGTGTPLTLGTTVVALDGY